MKFPFGEWSESFSYSCGGSNNLPIRKRHKPPQYKATTVSIPEGNLIGLYSCDKTSSTILPSKRLMMRSA